MKPVSIVFRIFLVVGILLTLIGLGLIINEIMFLNKAVLVQGTVTDLIEIKDHIDSGRGLHGLTYKPKIQFQTKDGKEKTVLLNMSSYPPIAEIGESVSVFYDPQNTYNVQVNSFISLWLLQTIFLLLGIVFLVFSVFGFWIIKRVGPLGVNYKIKLSREEMSYLFKRNKECPECGGALIKYGEEMDMGVGVTEWNGIDGTSYSYGQRYEVEYVFRCMQCDKIFPLKQLAGNPGIKN